MAVHEYHVLIARIKLYYNLTIEGANNMKIKLRGKVTFCEKTREQIMHSAFLLLFCSFGNWYNVSFIRTNANM